MAKLIKSKTKIQIKFKIAMTINDKYSPKKEDITCLYIRELGVCQITGYGNP